MTTPDQLDGVWVISDVTPDGTYVVSIHAGEDVAFTLDRTRALAYACAVMDAATRAAFDAAVLKQQLGLGMPIELVASVVNDLRKDRAPITWPHAISLEPFVSGASHKAGLYLDVNGKRIGQWTVDDARSHATDVLEVVAGVDLDAAYRRYLVGAIGLDDGRARALVGDIINHREP